MDRILTVVIPAVSTDLTTLDAVKAELGIGDTSRDTMLANFISAASVAAADLCDGTLVSETVSEQIRSYPFIDSSSLVNIPVYLELRRRPVTSIDSIVEDGVTLYLGTNYEADLTRGRLTRLYNDLPVRWWSRKLTIQYTAGYTFPGSLPPVISRAVIEIVKDMYSTNARDLSIRSEELQGVGKVEYFSGANTGSFPQIALDLLSPYQRPMF
jgi:Phage gp6-like head-tail connector protein